MKSRESRNNGRYNMQLHTMCIYVHQVHQWEFLNFSLPDLIYLYYFSLSAIEFVWCQFWEIFGIGWTNNPRLIDVFLYFHLSPWYCIDDCCRENSVLVTHEFYKVNCFRLFSCQCFKWQGIFFSSFPLHFARNSLWWKFPILKKITVTVLFTRLLILKANTWFRTNMLTSILHIDVIARVWFSPNLWKVCQMHYVFVW